LFLQIYLFSHHHVPLGSILHSSYMFKKTGILRLVFMSSSAIQSKSKSCTFTDRTTASALTYFHNLYHSSKLSLVYVLPEWPESLTFQSDREREILELRFRFSSLLLLHPSFPSCSHTHSHSPSRHTAVEHTPSSIIDACFRQMLQGLGLRQLLSLWRKKGARWWNRYFFPVILLT